MYCQASFDLHANKYKRQYYTYTTNITSHAQMACIALTNLLKKTDHTLQGSDKALGSIMLLAASTVFIYYTFWAILLVSLNIHLPLLYVNDI